MQKLSLFAVLSLLIMAVFPADALACPSCYGAISDTEIAQGLQLAMLALIGSISVVGVGVVMFFSNIQKRAALHEASKAERSSADSLETS